MKKAFGQPQYLAGFVINVISHHYYLCHHESCHANQQEAVSKDEDCNPGDACEGIVGLYGLMDSQASHCHPTAHCDCLNNQKSQKHESVTLSNRVSYLQYLQILAKEQRPPVMLAIMNLI